MQIPLHNHVLHTLHRLIQQIRVGRIGEVHVGLLARVTDEILELSREEVLGGFDVTFGTVIVREVGTDGRGARGDLFAEEVHFVEEEDEGGFLKVFAIGDGFEEHEGFVHLVLWDVC
jgi:hypothetical protein